MNTLCIEDNQNIIRAGLKKRINFPNGQINGSSQNNQDIIKQTLDLFQSIKRNVKKQQIRAKDEDKQKRSSGSGSCSSEDELNSSQQDINLADEDTQDTSPSNDYHSVWDNTDFILNGIIDLDELNLFQLYKLRSQNYPQQKTNLLTNQKIIANFQKLYNIMSEMRKRKKKHINNMVVTNVNNGPSKFEFNDNDWKNFQNDNLHVYTDFIQNDHYKKFEEYYNNFLNFESNKMRNNKYNRYEKAIIVQGNNSIIKQSLKFKVPEKLKKRLFMEENKDNNHQQNDGNQQEEDEKTQIKQQINLGSEKTISNSICNFPRNISTPFDKLPKNFQVRKVSPIRNFNSERSLNSSPTKKESRDENTPSISSFRNIQTLNHATSSNLIGLERTVGPIDNSIGKQNNQLIFGTKQIDNNLNRNNNIVHHHVIRSLNNFDFLDNEEETQKSCSPIKKMHNRFQSSEHLNFKANFKNVHQQQEQAIPSKDQTPIRKSIQNQFLSSNNARLSIDGVFQQKLLLSNKQLEACSSISPQKGHILQQVDNAKNQILKNPQFNYFSFKTHQQQNQQMGRHFLPRIASFHNNGSDIQKPVVQNNSEFNQNKGQKVDQQATDKKCFSSQKQTSKQTFLYDAKALQNECSKKPNNIELLN